MDERKRFSWWLVVPAAAAVSLLLHASPAHAGVEVGQAPALVIQELDGQAFDLSKLRGKVVIVNFWATWCPPCRQEMPVLEAFYHRYHDQGVELIGVSVDRPHDRQDVRTLMQSFSYPAAMLSDAKVNGFGPPLLLPVTYVIDSAGVVRARLSPEATAITEQSLAAVVLPLLSQHPAGAGS